MITFLVALAAVLILGGLLCTPRRNHVTKGMTYADRLAFWDSLTPEQQKRANDLGLY